MEAFVKPMEGLAEYEEIRKSLTENRGILQVAGCLDSQKAHWLYGLSDLHDCRLVVAEDDQKAKEFYEDYRFYQPDTLLYPAKDLLFYYADIQGNLLTKQRMRVIRGILEKKKVTVVTSMEGCMERLRPLQEIAASRLHLTNESSLNLEKLLKDLTSLGYERAGQIERSGQFCVRGGIVDIYSLTEENPWRIELWGDEVDSIRSFDVESQRSLENLKEITIYPAVEKYRKEDMVTFMDYFPKDRTLFVLDEPNRLKEKGNALEEEFQNSMRNRGEQGYENLQEELLCSFSQICKGFNQCCCMSLCMMEPQQADWNVTAKFSLMVKSISSYNNSFELLVKDLREWKIQGYRVVLLSGSRTRAKRLAGDLQDQNLNSFYSEDAGRTLAPGEIMVAYGHALRGFEYPLIQFAVIAETDIFGRKQKKKRKKKEYSGQRIQDFSELSIGDYVVHENHGLGIYRGIEKVEVDRVSKDYIKLEYQGGSNLYILATQLDMLQKYAGSDAGNVKLNKLGHPEWNRTKKKVRGAVQNIAKELVELYAARQDTQGYVYGPDTVWQREFEEMFPYEETDGQLQAIEDTKQDMESTKVMDRLICGDVGYGKTEIALRAAFKAIQEGKQVAYLVPTTILAQQHYNTFVQRMKDFPVTIDLLCRFRAASQQKKTIAELKKGMVDVVIGTHRLLSKDVEFKDLGLLVIDEEQRFGVRHKEKIKQLKKNVDVLTLTATPIPRTLHMSLIGIRDMSVLEEPPMDRVPIQTYVMEFDEETVREAIQRELNRGGQVYYVYNRVNDIVEMAAKVSRLVPDAQVSYAHGQMNERELEKIMYGFINGEIDVLVSTTIIETGLDISNVNTMIIHDSDRYGLSQLYQLRGRIGRSNRTAYAFLMYRKNQILRETAEKRLSAIREYTELGSGFKIAMRDLELRGAGNLLGADQHGHMLTVGYDLYCKMLSEAVKEAKGIHTVESFETTIDLNMDAFIPDTYIANEFQKLNLYKRIAGISNREEYEDMQEELLDRFGEPPRTVLNLLSIAFLKALGHSAYVTEIKQLGKEVQFRIFHKIRVGSQGLIQLKEKYGEKLHFAKGEKPGMFLETGKNVAKETEQFLVDFAQVSCDNSNR